MITVPVQVYFILFKALGYAAAILVGAYILATLLWSATGNSDLSVGSFWGSVFLGLLAVLINELKKREAALSRHRHEQRTVAASSHPPVLAISTVTRFDLKVGGVELHMTRYHEYVPGHCLLTATWCEEEAALQVHEDQLAAERRDREVKLRLSQDERDRFATFTVQARGVLSFAREEAERFQHNYIGTEHLLLGLVRENEGIAAAVLYDLGVGIQEVRSAVGFIIGRGDGNVLGELGLTPRATKVLELAADEARRLHHDAIGTEHLLLGVVREGEGIAAGVLQSLGVNLEKVRTQTIRVLKQQNDS